MRHGVESQGLLEQLSVELQELARVGRASIRDDKADIQILRMLGELREEALLREIHREGAELNTKVPCDMASDLIKQCLHVSSPFVHLNSATAARSVTPSFPSHNVLIQFLRRRTSITTTSGSLAPCATAAIPGKAEKSCIASLLESLSWPAARNFF